MTYDVVVIGGGQAGLSIGYYLKQQGKSFLILDEQGDVGDSWKKRYDSLVLFTPRNYSSLPGLTLKGDPNRYPTKDEVATYLSLYKNEFKLPVSNQSKVTKLEKVELLFHIHVSCGKTYQATQVVVASGAFHTPFVPDIVHGKQIDLFELHASEYKNPTQIPTGTVLVVGAGNTGVQIAAELTSSHKVVLSCSKKIKTLPQMILRKSLFWWFERLGIANKSADSLIGRKLQKNDPVIGNDIKMVKKKATIKDRLQSIKGTKATFQTADPVDVQSVIWATGYRNSYEWIQIDGVLDMKKQPIHIRGVTNVRGLYVLGLSWQHKRGSALLYGVGEDAVYIAACIKAFIE